MHQQKEKGSYYDYLHSFLINSESDFMFTNCVYILLINEVCLVEMPTNTYLQNEGYFFPMNHLLKDLIFSSGQQY